LRVVHFFVVDQSAAWVEHGHRHEPVVFLRLSQSDRGSLLRILNPNRGPYALGGACAKALRLQRISSITSRIPT
jgi:hypothetical protein